MKEGCPLSPTLFLLYYDVLRRKTLSRHPDAHLYVFVDDPTRTIEPSIISFCPSLVLPKLGSAIHF